MTTPVNAAAPLTPRLHPLMATAAIAVTTFSLAGIAAMSGLLPMTKAATADAPVAIEKPTQTLQTVQAVVETPVAKAAPKPVTRPVAKVAAPAAAPVELAQVGKVPQSVQDQPAPSTPPASMPQPAPLAAVPAPCIQCGVIDNVREVAQPGEGSGLGAVLGGVLGGVLGNQVGGGSGNKIATVLGAAGGAYAGHQYEKNRNQTTRYEISVRMQEGSLRSVMQDSLPAWRIGDRVRIDNNMLLAN